MWQVSAQVLESDHLDQNLGYFYYHNLGHFYYQ